MSGAVAVILAAGKGTRMGSPLPKPLVPLAGRGLVLRLLDAVALAGVPRTVVVVGHGADAVRAALPAGVSTALQPVRDGTAGAVLAAQGAAGDADEVFVFVGDSPLLRPQSIRVLAEARAKTGVACAFLTARFPVPYPYARVIRDDGGDVLCCIEERDCTEAQRTIDELLTSHFAFHGPSLWSALDAVVPNPDTGERYLTDVIGILMDRGLGVAAVPIGDWRELVGLNTPEDLAWAEGVLDDLS